MQVIVWRGPPMLKKNHVLEEKHNFMIVLHQNKLVFDSYNAYLRSTLNPIWEFVWMVPPPGKLLCPPLRVYICIIICEDDVNGSPRVNIYPGREIIDTCISCNGILYNPHKYITYTGKNIVKKNIKHCAKIV